MPPTIRGSAGTSLKRSKNTIWPKNTKVHDSSPVATQLRFSVGLFSKSEFLFLKNIISLAEVQGGTYIRKLVNDLGKELGVGAHMLELRRVRAGIFKEDSIVNLYDFEKAVDAYKDGKDKLLREIIIPGEIVSELHPVVEIKKDGLQEKIKDIEGD